MGSPVLYLHESIGSSRLIPDTDAGAGDLGLYNIAPERPGCGHSDTDPEFDFDSVSANLLNLLNHLRITRCQLLGFLSGAAYALTLANRHSTRISRIMLVAGRPPAPMTGRFGFLMTLRERMMGQPWLLSTFFNILRNRSSEETNGKLIRSVYGSVSHDRQLLKDKPELFAHMVNYTLESLSVSAAGVINELQCFNRATDISLDAIEAPIIAWHGSADVLATPEDLQQFLGDKISELRIFEDAGSLILLEYWEEVLGRLSAGADDL
jgi:pimeloyl-ACP methyl ester carboxylesterase